MAGHRIRREDDISAGTLQLGRGVVLTDAGGDFEIGVQRLGGKNEVEVIGVGG